MKGSLQQGAPPVFILEPTAVVLELTGELAFKVYYVLNVHLETQVLNILVIAGSFLQLGMQYIEIIKKNKRIKRR